MPEVDFKTVPFEEAITFLREKVNVPTETWDDLWQGMHSRAFVVAGAMKQELLSDFHDTINKAISDGETITDFRKRFDDIVTRHGWSYKGKRGWRTGVIFHTNMRTAYAAGQYAQMQAGKKERPFLRYIGGLSENPRPLHLEWSGMVLPFDDPWWNTHRPPNGWGCKCQIVSHSKSELKRDGHTVSKKGPDDGTYPWTNPRTGEVHTIPKGIDPGWDYDPGRTAWGSDHAKRVLDEAEGPWVDLDPMGPTAFGRPEILPVVTTTTALFRRSQSESGLRRGLKKSIGGDEMVFIDPLGEQTLVNQAIVDHMLAKTARLDGREQFFPLIRELIEDPYEIWGNFSRNEATGKVGLRKKYVKGIRVKGNVVIGLVLEVKDGAWQNLSFFRGGVTGAGNLRKGRLLYGK